MHQTTQPASVSDKVRNRLAGTVFVGQSFFSASTIAAFVLSPIIATAMTGSEDAAGIPNTVTLIGRALFAFPFGILMDRLGRRTALSAGYFTAFIGGLISFWAVIQNSYTAFLIGAFLIGMSRTAGDQSRFIAAEVFPTTRRARVIGIVVFAGTIGAVFGPWLVPPSVALMEQIGLPGNAGPFLITVGAMLLAAVVVQIFMRPDPAQIAQLVEAQENDEREAAGIFEAPKRPFQQIAVQPLFILSVLSMGLGYFVMTFLMVITPVHMNHHQHTTEGISSVIFWHTLGMFGLSFFTGYLVDRLGKIRVIIGGALLLIAACVVAPLSTALPVLWLALFLLGLGWNFTFVAGSSLLTDTLSASERAETQGMAEMMVAVISITASASVGTAFRVGDFWLVAVIGFAISMILLLSAYVLPRFNRPQEHAFANS